MVLYFKYSESGKVLHCSMFLLEALIPEPDDLCLDPSSAPHWFYHVELALNISVSLLPHT